MKKVYYAHALCVYGTACETAELRAIRTRFKGCRIVNPSRYDGDPEKAKDTVGFCLKLVERCDTVVFSRLLGKVTAGVGKEVNHAFKLGLPVYELEEKSIVRLNQKVTYLSRDRTKQLYRKWWDVRGGNPW